MRTEKLWQQNNITIFHIHLDSTIWYECPFYVLMVAQPPQRSNKNMKFIRKRNYGKTNETGKKWREHSNSDSSAYNRRLCLRCGAKMSRAGKREHEETKGYTVCLFCIFKSKELCFSGKIRTTGPKDIRYIKYHYRTVFCLSHPLRTTSVYN